MRQIFSIFISMLVEAAKPCASRANRRVDPSEWRFCGGMFDVVYRYWHAGCDIIGHGV